MHRTKRAVRLGNLFTSMLLAWLALALTGYPAEPQLTPKSPFRFSCTLTTGDSTSSRIKCPNQFLSLKPSVSISLFRPSLSFRLQPSTIFKDPSSDSKRTPVLDIRISNFPSVKLDELPMSHFPYHTARPFTLRGDGSCSQPRIRIYQFGPLSSIECSGDQPRILIHPLPSNPDSPSSESGPCVLIIIGPLVLK